MGRLRTWWRSWGVVWAVLVFAAHAAAQPPREQPICLGLSISADGRHLATCGDRVRIFDLRTGRRVPELETAGESPKPETDAEPEWRWPWKVGPDERISRVIAFSPTEPNVLAIGFDSGRIQLWRFGAVRVRQELTREMGEPRALAFTPDGQFLMSASTRFQFQKPPKGHLISWRTAGGRRLRVLERDRSIEGLSISRDGQQLAFCAGNTVELIEPETFESIGTASLPTGDRKGSPFGAATGFANNDQRLYIAGAISEQVGKKTRAAGALWTLDLQDAGTIQLIDPPSSEMLRTLAVSPDGKRVITSRPARNGRIQTMALRDAASGDVIWSTDRLFSEPDAIHFSPDGRFVAWCQSNRIELADALTGETVWTFVP